MRIVGVSLKMYFGYEQTLSWCREVANIAGSSAEIISGQTQLFVLPSAPALPAAVEILRPARVHVGAQNMYWLSSGAFTGEIGPAMLAEIGCEMVAIGHAERRTLFGETEADIARKVLAAVDHGLRPVLCVGESNHGPIDDAIATCIGQLDAGLMGIAKSLARVVIAYEPVWSIGAQQPAETAYIAGVCGALKRHAVQALGLTRAAVIYGGTAGSGLLSRLGSSVDGVFLGRRAHDTNVLREVLSEATNQPTVTREST